MEVQDLAGIRGTPILPLNYSTQRSAPPAPSLWQCIALIIILLISAFFDFFKLDQIGFGNTYYATGIKSMLMNWHNFFFVAFDPAGFITIDKPPLGFWIQVLSVRILGFSGFSLLLPEALAGVLSVALLYHLVARNFGPPAGLLAALALAVTPISVVTNRNNTIDSLLVFVVLLAIWAISRATENGQLRWLLVGALLIGLGFNIKMLEAYLVVPALALLYLLGAPLRWYQRLLHLVLALLVLLAVSLSWILIVDLTPPDQRPYVGSTLSNSELDLAIGYNGLQRLLGHRVNTPLPSRRSATTLTLPHGYLAQSALTPQAPGNELPVDGNGLPGPWRLFTTNLANQISWLLPLAACALLALAWQPRLRLPFDRERQALVLWGVCTLVMSCFFSVALFFNTYYMVLFSPSICALFGIGIAIMWQDYLRPGWRGWLLPLALLATALFQTQVLLAPFTDWSRALSSLIVITCFLAALLLVIVRSFYYTLSKNTYHTFTGKNAPIDRNMLASHTIRFLACISVTIGALLLLVAPTAWSGFSVILHGDVLQTSAGPGQNLPTSSTTRNLEYSVPSNLALYLQAHQGRARFLAATMTTGPAIPLILETGQPVMAIGGFKGADPTLTVEQLSTLVKNDTVHFFLFPLQARGNALIIWADLHCHAVSSRLVRAMSSHPGSGIGADLHLLDCSTLLLGG